MCWAAKAWYKPFYLQHTESCGWLSQIALYLTCEGRTQVGQSYDPVPSSNTLHHVVAAVFASTGTQHEKQAVK